MNPHVPANYFPNDNPQEQPIVRWRSAGQLFYSNWLNYYVYQSTPYDVKEIAEDSAESHLVNGE